MLLLLLLLSLFIYFQFVFPSLQTKQENWKTTSILHHYSCFSYWWTIFPSSPFFNWSLESPLKPLQWHSVSISEWCQARISVIAHKLQIELKLYYFLLRCLMHEFSYLVWLSWWHTIFFFPFFFLKLHEFLWICFKICSSKTIARQTFPSIVSSAPGLKPNDYTGMVYFWEGRNSLQRWI